MKFQNFKSNLELGIKLCCEWLASKNLELRRKMSQKDLSGGLKHL